MCDDPTAASLTSACAALRKVGRLWCLCHFSHAPELILQVYIILMPVVLPFSSSSFFKNKHTKRPVVWIPPCAGARACG